MDEKLSSLFVQTNAPPPAPPGGADAILCPLCEYDLRGLPAPRCPECGYTASWEDLLDPQRRLHPYLFEHHPQRPVRAFWKTLVGGLRPRRFWDNLFPTMPSRPKRLVAFWLLAATPIVLALVAACVITVVEHARVSANMRTTVAAGITRRQLRDIERQFGSVEQFIEASFPLPPSLAFFRGVYYAGFGPALWVVLMWLAWPWLTFVSLLIFRFSMRRARIRPVHVLRCVLYSFDGVFWIGLLFAAGLVARMSKLTIPFTPRQGWPGALFYILPPLEDPSVAALFVGGVAMTAFMTFRLVVAFRSYLKFDHPVATVVATQILVLLALLVVALGRV